MSITLLTASLSRREFIQSSVATAAALTRSIGDRQHSEHWVMNSCDGLCWPVEEHATWALTNLDKPILRRAQEGLMRLSRSEADRVRRLITRRCRLKLITVRRGSVEVQYWNKQGLGDLRPFFKLHQLHDENVEVILIDRKRESSELKRGDDFKYGERLQRDFPFDLYWTKWRRSADQDRDDWFSAPFSETSFGWKQTGPGSIPWIVLKSIWRRSTTMECLNCDRPTLVTRIDSQSFGMCYNMRRYLYHACNKCRRTFEVPIQRRWIVENIDQSLWPDFERRHANHAFRFM